MNRTELPWRKERRCARRCPGTRCPGRTQLPRVRDAATGQHPWNSACKRKSRSIEIRSDVPKLQDFRKHLSVEYYLLVRGKTTAKASAMLDIGLLVLIAIAVDIHVRPLLLSYR